MAATTKGLIGSIIKPLTSAAPIEASPNPLPVENSLANAVASDSPLIQGARTRAAQSMNDRGLLNSSMAIQAGEAAAYDAAAPFALQEQRGAQALDVANVEANYKQLMQANASAAQIFSDVTKNISSIMESPDTTPEQKQAAVTKQNEILRAGLGIIGGISNLNLGDLLNFDPTTAAVTPTGAAPGQINSTVPQAPGGSWQPDAQAG